MGDLIESRPTCMCLSNRSLRTLTVILLPQTCLWPSALMDVCSIRELRCPSLTKLFTDLGLSSVLP